VHLKTSSHRPTMPPLGTTHCCHKPLAIIPNHHPSSCIRLLILASSLYPARLTKTRCGPPKCLKPPTVTHLRVYSGNPIHHEVNTPSYPFFSHSHPTMSHDDIDDLLAPRGCKNVMDQTKQWVAFLPVAWAPRRLVIMFGCIITGLAPST